MSIGSHNRQPSRGVWSSSIRDTVSAARSSERRSWASDVTAGHQGMVDDQVSSIEAAARLVVASDYVVALVGAGLSVESGIPTFRGPGGLWTRLGEPSMRGYQDFLEGPLAWWEQQQDEQADLARTEFRSAIDRGRAERGALRAGRARDHRRAEGHHHPERRRPPPQSGSTNVAEIHGSRTKLRCVGCESRWPREEFCHRRLSSAVSRVRRPGQVRYGHVRRAHPAGHFGYLLRADGSVRLHDNRRHVGHGVPCS